MKFKIDIVFEDDDLIVINKPPDLLVIPDRYNNTRASVKSIFDKKYGKVYIVHRIDRETSGLLLLAKNEAYHRRLSLMFENQKIKKQYHAIVKGNPNPAKATIENRLDTTMKSVKKVLVAKKGKKSSSTYKIIEAYHQFALCEIQIRTGRTHQIRVHMQSIGHPLMVDQLYGGQKEFYLSEIKGRKYKRSGYEEKPLMKRLTLHAAKLSFIEPKTQKEMSFEAPYPKDFRAVIYQLRKLRKV